MLLLKIIKKSSKKNNSEGSEGRGDNILIMSKENYDNS